MFKTLLYKKFSLNGDLLIIRLGLNLELLFGVSVRFFRDYKSLSIYILCFSLTFEFDQSGKYHGRLT